MVTITVLITGVFSAQDRRIDASGIIRFTPDLRAAVDVTYKIENAWTVSGGSTQKVAETVYSFKNYTENGANNPTIHEEFSGTGLQAGKIYHPALVFDPGATSASQIKLTFTVTNRSARNDKNIRVRFSSVGGAGKLIQGPGVNPMNFTIDGGISNEIISSANSIMKGSTATIIIYFNLTDATKSHEYLEFDFSFSFEFLP